MQNLAQFDTVNPALSLTAMHDRMVVFARDEAGRLIHIDSVRRGLACKARCLACGEALIARQGDIKAHSFAHTSGTECPYAIDAPWNHLAMNLIITNPHRRFATPALTVKVKEAGPLTTITYKDRIESMQIQIQSVAIATRIREKCPGVVMQVKGRELLLEVTQGHRLDQRGRSTIDKLQLPAIELHLADRECATIEQFADILFEDISHKHWLYNPRANAIRSQLDARVQKELTEQINQHTHEQEQKLREQAEHAAALLRRQLETQAALTERLRLQAQQDQLHRQKQKYLENAARAAKQAAHQHSSTAQSKHCIHMIDGGISFSTISGGQVLFVPETGREQAIAVFTKWEVSLDTQLGGYPVTLAQSGNIFPELWRYSTGIKPT